MLEALEKTLGVVTSAAKMAGIHRTTHYTWLVDDPEYKKSVDDCGDVALDYAESQLHKQIGEGQPASTIFYLKTKGKKRGYVEKTELGLTDKNGNDVPFQLNFNPAKNCEPINPAEDHKSE